MTVAISLRALAWTGLAVLAATATAAVRAAPADAPGHVTGIGGVFLKAKDPKALGAWYRDVLGLPVEAWGAVLKYDAPKHPNAAAWAAFPASSTYFAPSASPFMIDYAVDDLDAILARLKAQGVEVLKQSSDDANGRFAWVLDPEGNKVELWEPKRAATP